MYIFVVSLSAFAIYLKLRFQDFDSTCSPKLFILITVFNDIILFYIKKELGKCSTEQNEPIIFPLS
jgi:hypothetical protein